MDETFASLYLEFIEDSLPLAEGVSRRCLDLERAWEAGDHDGGALQQIKSELHTLKGSAAMMGLGPLTAVTHALEDLCALGADGSTRSAAVIELLLEGGDLLQAMVKAAADEGLHERAANELIARVTLFVEPRRADKPSPRDPSDPSDPSGPSDAAPRSRLADPGGAGALGDTLRVPLHRLDRMLEWVGEAMILQSSLAESSSSLLRVVGDTPETDRVDRTAVSLKKILKQLQVALMDARLVPVATLFERFRRSARDLSRERGQPIRLTMRGGETMLDKAIVDRLGEPILHLVRNAAAHGLEPPEARTAAGKPAEGTITLSARCLSNEVVISVEDDGRGLDLPAISARAEAMGHEASHLAPDEALRLIFTPGLSTAEEVSPLAGRGMGLLVVASAASAMGARIDVESTPGAGAAFHLILPPTLTMSQALLVEIDRETFALQASHVLECLRVPKGALHEVYQLGVLSWRGHILHASDGGELVGLGGPDRPDKIERPLCVVLASGARLRGLLVDRLLGYQEIVIKPLDPALGQPAGIAGATLLADGRVVLILDAAWITERRVAEPRPPRDRGPPRGLGDLERARGGSA